MLKQKKNRRHVSRRQVANRHIACETLENRRMFVTYQVTGTSAADAISISIDEANNKIISAVNGISDSGSDIINNNIEINGLGGNDTITIGETGGNTVVINAGAGNDTINIALGTNDLDNIEDNITINGDADTDTVNLCDDDNTTPAAFSFTSGNVIGRTGMPSATVNAEIVEVRGGTSADNFNVSDAPSFLVTRLLGNSGSDVLNLVGAAGETSALHPNPAVNGSGTVFFPVDNSDLTFSSIQTVQAQNFDDFTLETPSPNDTITINAGNTIAGSSGGVAFPTVVFTNLGALTLDVGANDGGAGNDTLTFFGTTSEAALINVNAETGTNTLTNFGNFTIDTGLGTNGGDNLKVVDNQGALSFHGIQQLQRLEVNSGGVVSFDGVDTRISVGVLAVVSGVGTFDMAANQNAIVPVGSSFFIGAGCTLIKKGLGSMAIDGTQSHAAGAVLKVENGTLNVGSDAGTAGTHPLALWAAGGTLNLQSTQHVHSVTADVGIVRMATNGSRVLVTDLVSTGSEGGAIDLRDNDMIVNYTNVADAVAARALLHSGRGNGSWAGLGINSSLAATIVPKKTTLGSMEATEFKSIYGPSATFDGETLDNTMVLIKYTYYGDANFNGKVDGGDYSRIDTTFNKEHTAGNIGGWINGDFNDDGKVDGADYALIDGAFNSQGAVVLRPSAGAPTKPTGPGGRETAGGTIFR